MTHRNDSLLERDVERHLVKRVAEMGGRCFKWVSPGHAGVPDRIAILPGGRVAFIELKRPGQKPRALQQAMLNILNGLGCRTACLDTREAVDAFLA
jgi:hypothetical protein